MTGNRWLVTGASGFVGGHLLDRLLGSGEKVFAFVMPKTQELPARVKRIEGSLLRYGDIAKAVRIAKPTYVVHLAGITAPAACEAAPKKAWNVNVQGTERLLKALATLAPQARCLLLSSAFVYRPGNRAYTESSSVRPRSLYGRSKLAVEQLGISYAKRGLHISIARPFNLIGPGQSENFLAPAVARQIASAERSRRSGKISVGNTGNIRDFLDVRDAVRAFLAILCHGLTGEIYNVCSGEPRSVSELVESLVSRSRVPLEIVTENGRQKKADHPRLAGSCEKLRRDCAWRPRIRFSQSLQELLNAYRRRH